MNFSSSGLRLQSGGNYNSQQPRRERNRSTSRLPFPVGHQLQLPAPLPKAAGGCGGQLRSESQGGWPQSHAPRTVLGEAAGSGAGVAERRSDVTSGGRPAGRPAQIERSVLSSALSSAAPASHVVAEVSRGRWRRVSEPPPGRPSRKVSGAGCAKTG